jgi:hypothetical protein
MTSANPESSSEIMKCVKCNDICGQGQDYIDHLLTKHPTYMPQVKTLATFGVEKCLLCKILVVTSAHACNVINEAHPTKPSFQMPGRDYHSESVFISWTVTANGKDTNPAIFTHVCEWLEQYSEVAVCATERGARHKHLHLQITCELKYNKDDNHIKWLKTQVGKFLRDIPSGGLSIKHQFKVFEVTHLLFQS